MIPVIAFFWVDMPFVVFFFCKNIKFGPPKTHKIHNFPITFFCPVGVKKIFACFLTVGASIRPIIHVSAVNDELLSAVGKLTAEYGRIGGNLNQIARYLNEYGVPYNALSGEVRAAIADLAALKYEILQKVGDAVGNTQAYQL